MYCVTLVVKSNKNVTFLYKLLIAENDDDVRYVSAVRFFKYFKGIKR